MLLILAYGLDPLLFTHPWALITLRLKAYNSKANCCNLLKYKVLTLLFCLWMNHWIFSCIDDVHCAICIILIQNYFLNVIILINMQSLLAVTVFVHDCSFYAFHFISKLVLLIIVYQYYIKIIEIIKVIQNFNLILRFGYNCSLILANIPSHNKHIVK